MPTRMRTLVIGDVHGCLDKLVALLKDLSYRPGRDQLVFVGDLVDRGPNSVETVAFVRLLCKEGRVHVVRGNHEARYARYWMRLGRRRGARMYALRLSLERLSVLKSLTEDDLDWMAALPYYFLGDGFRDAADPYTE